MYRKKTNEIAIVKRVRNAVKLEDMTERFVFMMNAYTLTSVNNVLDMSFECSFHDMSHLDGFFSHHCWIHLCRSTTIVKVTNI